jgi:hypothetical protein
MSFWNSPKLEPTRKFRFQVSSFSVQQDGPWIHAKTVDKPSYDINTTDFQIGNAKITYPGIATWNDVNITVVDTGGKTGWLYTNLVSMGYNVPGKPNPGIFKAESAGAYITDIIIEQLDSKGAPLEQWALMNAMIKSVNFGNLSYEDDGLVEIQLTIAYDYATFGGQSKQSDSGAPVDNDRRLTWAEKRNEKQQTRDANKAERGDRKEERKAARILRNSEGPAKGKERIVPEE